MTSRLSWSGDRRRPIKDLQSNVRTYFIKKSRNIWIRELLESLFDSFFPDLSTFVIEHQITNNMLNNINSAKVDKFFFDAVVNDVAVFKDTRILSQIREALKKHHFFVTNVTLWGRGLERVHVTKKPIASKSFLSNFKHF